jgi:hypothetical protein
LAAVGFGGRFAVKLFWRRVVAKRPGTGFQLQGNIREVRFLVDVLGGEDAVQGVLGVGFLWAQLEIEFQAVFFV